MLYQGGYPFQRMALSGVLPINFAAETEGGRGVVGQPLPLKRGYPSGLGTQPIPTKHNNTRSGRPIPSEHQGFGQWIVLLIWNGRQHQRLLAGVSSSNLPVYTSHRCLYQGEAYSHQWPRCGERFLGRYTPVEQFRGRLREWRLGERDPRCCEGPGKRFPTVRPGSGMSTTDPRRLLLGGQRLWLAACLGEWRGAAGI